jgi:hypothetical protein
VLFKPGILALFLSSLLILGMVLYASFYGALILRYWNLKSGSETQLKLERRTYLISTLMGYALVFQLLSFFLFIYTADSLHPFFTGAMCAVGSLNVNQWGYPVVIFKIITSRNTLRFFSGTLFTTRVAMPCSISFGSMISRKCLATVRRLS